MRHRLLRSVSALAVAMTLGSSSTAWAQRTPWGEPSIEGLWTTQTMTPLERPGDLAAKPVLTNEEAVAYEKQRLETRNQDRRDGTAEADVARAYNDFWWDRGTKVVPGGRTSLVIDPPDGRIPWTAEARRTEAVRAEARRAFLESRVPIESALDIDTGERCITDGLPMLPGAYNANFLILQTPGYVTILSEMFRNLRVIPTDGRPHGHVPQWLGDARGRWEGNTLVVETTNFADKTHYWWSATWRSARPTLHLVERFTRVDAENIDYQFTIKDPTMFTVPWTAAVPMTTNQASRGVTQGHMYEYACHEGNYSIVNVLNGARAGEKAAAESAKRGSN